MSYYRKCAGIIVFNQNKKVLVCARIGYKTDQWQFPQGGIMKKEPIEQAAFRELQEETSITSVKLVKVCDKPICYDFPGRIRRQMIRCGIDSLGQEMYWSLLYFYGADSEINVHTKQPEFKSYEWVDMDEAVKRIIYFKKKTYEEVASIFKPYIQNFALPD